MNSIRRKNILLVEDEPLIAAMEKKQIEKEVVVLLFYK